MLGPSHLWNSNGGPAGATVASRLAKTPKAPSVLLLEAGGPNADIEHRTLADRRLERHQLRLLDVWLQRADFDEWARLVEDDAFNYENARCRYDKIENYDLNIDGSNQRYAKPSAKGHGTAGPVPVQFAPVWEDGAHDILDAAGECGIGMNADLNSEDLLGMGMCPSTAHTGTRATAASAFLQDVPFNLTIITDAPATKILFEGKKAVGVEAGGKNYTVTKEIIISAGAIETPKLLLLSGVGPNADLATHGIPLVHDLSGVGRNLQDHVVLGMAVQQRPGVVGPSIMNGDSALLAAAREQFRKDKTGALVNTNAGILMGWQHLARETVPTYEIMAACPPSTALADPQHTYLTVVVALMVPQSCGTVTLASANPVDPPLCDPRFLSDPFDRANMVAAVRRAMRLYTHPSLAKDLEAPLTLPKSDGDADIWAYVQQHAGSEWHMSSTAKMGRKGDEMACVDSAFRVMGVQGLRVVDMSVAPFVPNCHTVAVAYQIGEAAAERLVSGYGLEG
ncbi:hypothetical protein B0A49_08881 [Cryomyces minteri]|uniref:Glucose-methanol-choline oxidoreductase N-terminal domain-containing protein n=1 Tax=Cryomyces minteri TaxID=331657 RepID=A0A4U0WEY9_9PEZI|nr:hypothetical protein B0A49_08881 [Cryomyces minteri]